LGPASYVVDPQRCSSTVAGEGARCVRPGESGTADPGVRGPCAGGPGACVPSLCSPGACGVNDCSPGACGVNDCSPGAHGSSAGGPRAGGTGGGGPGARDRLPWAPSAFHAAQAGNPDRAHGLARGSCQTPSPGGSWPVGPSDRCRGRARYPCRMGPSVGPAPADCRLGARSAWWPGGQDRSSRVRTDRSTRPANRRRGAAGPCRGPGTSSGCRTPATGFAGSRCGSGRRGTDVLG
jgi:hypothetical protein